MDKKKKIDVTLSQRITGLGTVKKKPANKAQGFIKEMREEMKKVSWTTREELRICGKIVIGTVFALGFGIYFIDLCIRFCLSGVGHFVRIIGA